MYIYIYISSVGTNFHVYYLMSDSIPILLYSVTAVCCVLSTCVYVLWTISVTGEEWVLSYPDGWSDSGGGEMWFWSVI